jgi:hypothetical protein
MKIFPLLLFRQTKRVPCVDLCLKNQFMLFLTWQVRYFDKLFSAIFNIIFFTVNGNQEEEEEEEEENEAETENDDELDDGAEEGGDQGQEIIAEVQEAMAEVDGGENAEVREMAEVNGI